MTKKKTWRTTNSVAAVLKGDEICSREEAHLVISETVHLKARFLGIFFYLSESFLFSGTFKGKHMLRHTDFILRGFLLYRSKLFGEICSVAATITARHVFLLASF